MRFRWCPMMTAHIGVSSSVWRSGSFLKSLWCGVSNLRGCFCTFYYKLLLTKDTKMGSDMMYIVIMISNIILSLSLHWTWKNMFAMKRENAEYWIADDCLPLYQLIIVQYLMCWTFKSLVSLKLTGLLNKCFRFIIVSNEEKHYIFNKLFSMQCTIQV